MNKFHKIVASILAVLMLLTSGSFTTLAAEESTVEKQPEAVVLAASGGATIDSAGILDGINIDWENYVVESTGTKLTRDYHLGLSDDYLYDSMPVGSTEERFNYLRSKMPEEIPCFAPYTKAEIAASKVKLYVSPDGDDKNPGTFEEPLKTPARAVELVNKLRSKRGGVTVYFREGIYSIPETLEFGRKSGGSSEKDLVFYSNYNNEKVIFTGAVAFTGSQLKKADDPVFNKKIRVGAKDHVYSIDLRALGYEPPANTVDPASRTLYIDGNQYSVARWPNDGYTNMLEYKGPGAVAGVINPGDITTTAGGVAPYTGERGIGSEFMVAHPRPFGWENTDTIWVRGYFFAEYWVYNHRVKNLKSDSQSVELYSNHGYGSKYIPEKNFYYYNILEELDSPGEWYWDYNTGMLYVYPSVKIKDDTLIQLVTTSNDILYLNHTKYSVINGITFDTGYQAIVLDGEAEYNLVQRCTIKNMSSGCMRFNLTAHNGLICSELHGSVGLHGRVPEEGGYSSGNFVQNNYLQGASIHGTRAVFSHNVSVGTSSMGLTLHYDRGSDRIVEYNEVVASPDVGLDAGVIYNNGSARSPGNIIRYNFLNKATIKPRATPYGIYLDDHSEGQYAYGNILRECLIFLHSDSDCVVYNNMICDLGSTMNSLHNSDNYTNLRDSWNTKVINSSENRYTRRHPYYFSRSWSSRYPYHYELQSGAVEAREIIKDLGSNYTPELDPLGTYLSSPKRNVYKNNVFINATYDLAKGSVREIDPVDENNYVYEDPSAFNFTDWENGVYDADPELFAELCPGVEPMVSINKVGIVFDPALVPAPMELGGITPLSPMDSEEVKILPNGIILRWNEVFGKSSYNVKLAKDPEFKELIIDVETQEEQVVLPELEFGQQYWWTVSTNQWSQNFSQTPSVMDTATFKIYSYDEAAGIAELEKIEINAAIESMKAFLENGFIVEEGTPEAENYPSDMPIYKAGTMDRLYQYIKDVEKQRDECRVQSELDNLAVQSQRDFYILMDENSYDYVVNLGTGSYEFNEENYVAPSAALGVDYKGDSAKLDSATSIISNKVRALNGRATLAMSIYHDKLDQWTGVDLRGASQIKGGLTSVAGYCIVLKPDIIELQRYPQQEGESSVIIYEFVNDNKFAKGGEWLDLTSQVIPESDGVHVIVRINGETVIDHLDKKAPAEYFAPGYFALMNNVSNIATEYASIKDTSLIASDVVNTKDLEKAISNAKDFKATIIEGEGTASQLTYKTGTIAKLDNALAAADAALAAAESNEAVRKATKALNNAVSDIKENDSNAFVYTISEIDESLWDNSSELAVVDIAPDKSFIAATPDDTASTVLTYNKALSPKQSMKFNIQYNQIGNWLAIATRQVTPGTGPTGSRAYFFVIKEDLIEFQKYVRGGYHSDTILKTVENGGQIESGKTYEIEIGSVNVDGGVLSTLKVNGKVVLEYLDTEDPIYEEGYLTFYCHRGLGTVTVSSIK